MDVSAKVGLCHPTQLTETSFDSLKKESLRESRALSVSMSEKLLSIKNLEDPNGYVKPVLSNLELALKRLNLEIEKDAFDSVRLERCSFRVVLTGMVLDAGVKKVFKD